MNAAATALAAIWADAGLAADALNQVTLTGNEPAVPSSFAIGTAAQASVAAAALAAAEIWHLRTGHRQQVGVDMRSACAESSCHFTVDGKAPNIWEKYSGLYSCGDAVGAPGHVRIHANFAHHRDRALRVLGLPAGNDASRDDVASALRHWRATDYELAAIDAGAVVSALRTFAEWDVLPQAALIAAAPLVSIEKIGDAPQLAWPAIDASKPPLQDIRVLDLTRILAGPLGGRTLAAYGADVMMVNSPKLPNIDAIMELSRGKLSAHADLDEAEGVAALQRLVREAHVFVQGYRLHALSGKGFSATDLAQLRPGIVCVSLSAYGESGPWAERRGFDSLVQTATGFNHAEGEAFADVTEVYEPRALPLQILDCATGFLIAFGAQAALARQAREGGSWHVRVSLARTGRWLRDLGRVDGTAAPKLSYDDLLTTAESGFGTLVGIAHAAQFESTPARWLRPSMPPGSHPPVWPPQGSFK